VEDVQSAFGYIPRGLHDFSTFFAAPLSGYNIPLPFFSDASSPLWHAAIGYEITGIVGVLLIGAVIWLFARAFSRGDGADAMGTQGISA
jgi:hypothetical protein